MKIDDQVIPARFLVTLGHLIGALMVIKTKSDNLYAGLPYNATEDEIARAKDYMNVSIVSHKGKLSIAASPRSRANDPRSFSKAFIFNASAYKPCTTVLKCLFE